MIPEGLVLLTSVAFAAGVVRLGRRRVLVQELAAIEGLARVDVVCIDKTGTITEPELTVTAAEPLAGGVDLPRVLGALAAADPDPNPSMRALARVFATGGAIGRADAAPWRVPFSSARRFCAVGSDGGGCVLGAPDARWRLAEVGWAPNAVAQWTLTALATSARQADHDRTEPPRVLAAVGLDRTGPGRVAVAFRPRPRRMQRRIGFARW
jgi:cation-transporting ATPase E